MHIACRLVQAIHWVTSFPLSLCKADTEQGGLCSLQMKFNCSALKTVTPNFDQNAPRFEAPKCYLHSKEILVPRFSGLNGGS